MRLLGIPLPNAPGPLRRLLLRVTYDYITRLDRHDPDLTILNYGYAEGPPPAGQDYDPLRLRRQLYHHVAGAADLEGRDVLEVGSGRGGGACYVAATFKPASLTGVDLSKAAVEFCRRRYAGQPGLTFVHGKAESLPFPSASFHAVINVESSHGYASMDRFLAEAARVLRPGGWFLWADFRLAEHMAELRASFAQAGLRVDRERLITPNVIEALDQDEAYKARVIETKVRRRLQGAARVFAGMRGTTMYESFKSGSREYWSFALRKPE